LPAKEELMKLQLASGKKFQRCDEDGLGLTDTALCPWANGTVEVTNRAVLRVFRAMLTEWKMPTNAWPRLTPLVQMILNNTPVDSLGGKAPITAMTGREPMGQLDPLVWRLEAEPTSLDKVWTMQGREVRDLQ
jgi:hypothetical protein